MQTHRRKRVRTYQYATQLVLGYRCICGRQPAVLPTVVHHVVLTIPLYGDNIILVENSKSRGSNQSMTADDEARVSEYRENMKLGSVLR